MREKGGWGFPRGKCSEGESDEACAIREVQEELSFSIFSILYFNLHEQTNLYIEFILILERYK